MGIDARLWHGTLNAYPFHLQHIFISIHSMRDRGDENFHWQQLDWRARRPYQSPLIAQRQRCLLGCRLFQVVFFVAGENITYPEPHQVDILVSFSRWMSISP